MAYRNTVILGILLALPCVPRDALAAKSELDYRLLPDVLQLDAVAEYRAVKYVGYDIRGSDSLSKAMLRLQAFRYFTIYEASYMTNSFAEGANPVKTGDPTTDYLMQNFVLGISLGQGWMPLLQYVWHDRDLTVTSSEIDSSEPTGFHIQKQGIALGARNAGCGYHPCIKGRAVSAHIAAQYDRLEIQERGSTESSYHYDVTSLWFRAYRDRPLVTGMGCAFEYYIPESGKDLEPALVGKVFLEVGTTVSLPHLDLRARAFVDYTWMRPTNNDGWCDTCEKEPEDILPGMESILGVSISAQLTL